MANLTAKFQLIDEMSQKLEGIAATGEAMLDNWESAGDTASAALDGISSSASSVESSLDGATSILENTMQQRTTRPRKPTTGRTRSAATIKP